MKFSIAGNGNVAWHFAEMLTRSGHKLLQVYARDKGSAVALTAAYRAEYIDAPEHFTSENDAIILAVSDSAITEVASHIADDFLVIHTSGGSDMDELKQTKRAVIWPVQSLMRQKEAAYNRIPFLLEASDKESEAFLLAVMKNISGRVIVATSAQRLQAHIAAVFANNFTNVLYAAAEEILQGNDLPSDLLLPLIEGHVDKLHHYHAYELQTGPARRGDLSTIRHHLSELKDMPAESELYKLLSDYIYEKFNGKKL